MRVGISLTSNYPDVKDPRQGARWMIERAAASRRAGLDSLFVGDPHVSPTPYYQNTPILGRLLAGWGEAPARCLFLLPFWHPFLVPSPIPTSPAGSRPRGAGGGGLDRERQPHKRGDPRAGRHVSRALRRLRQNAGRRRSAA